MLSFLSLTSQQHLRKLPTPFFFLETLPLVFMTMHSPGFLSIALDAQQSFSLHPLVFSYYIPSSREETGIVQQSDSSLQRHPHPPMCPNVSFIILIFSNIGSRQLTDGGVRPPPEQVLQKQSSLTLQNVRVLCHVYSILGLEFKLGGNRQKKSCQYVYL